MDTVEQRVYTNLDRSDLGRDQDYATVMIFASVVRLSEHSFVEGNSISQAQPERSRLSRPLQRLQPQLPGSLSETPWVMMDSIRLILDVDFLAIVFG